MPVTVFSFSDDECHNFGDLELFPFDAIEDGAVPHFSSLVPEPEAMKRKLFVSDSWSSCLAWIELLSAPTHFCHHRRDPELCKPSSNFSIIIIVLGVKIITPHNTVETFYGNRPSLYTWSQAVFFYKLHYLYVVDEFEERICPRTCCGACDVVFLLLLCIKWKASKWDLSVRIVFVNLLIEISQA